MFLVTNNLKLRNSHLQEFNINLKSYNKEKSEMENEKFTNLLNGVTEPMKVEEIVQFGVYCSSKNLSLEQWINISHTLYQIDFQLCYQLLIFVQKNQLNRNTYKDFIHQTGKIQIYNTLAVLTLAKALRQNNKQGMERILDEMRRFQSASEKVNMSVDKNIMFIRGFLFYYNGEMGKAINVFKNSYEEISHNARTMEDQRLPLLSILMLAQINFIQKNYQQALNFYKKALLLCKGLPYKARLGMAYSFYELEKYQLAEICFKKILKIHQTCIEALIGVAIIRYKDEDIQGYFQYLMKAYNLNNKHPLVLLHLAEHFLIRGDKEKALKLSEVGLVEVQKMVKFIKIQSLYRNDVEEFRARFNNIIGQVHHINHDYENCIKHYTEAQNKNLPHNEISLAQAYIYNNMYKDALTIMQKIFKGVDNRTVKQLGIMNRTMAFLILKVPSKHSERDPQFYFREAIKYNKNDFQACVDYGSYLGETQKQTALKFMLNGKKIVQDLKKTVKPDLLNNIGVFYLENNQNISAIQILQKCQKMIQHYTPTNHDEQMKHQSLCLTIYFNLALACQRNFQYAKAIDLHNKILTMNKFYVDSCVQLAYIYYRLGNKKSAYQILEENIVGFDPYKMKPYIRIDKLITLKAHFQHLDGSNGESKQTLRELSKMKHLYNQLYELSLNYENMMRKQVQMVVMKDFLRPNRGFCLNKCRQDAFNFYAYMICIVLLLTDHKITNEQGLFYFNCLKLAQIQFPIILYNYGIFRLQCQDYPGAIFAFNRYNEKTGTNRAGELISLCNLLSQNFNESLRVIKLNMLKDPTNMKYRFQYAYAIEKKIQKLFEEQGRKDLQQLQQSSLQLGMCQNIYKALAKLAPSDYIRNVDHPDMKERVRNEILKIRTQSDDRRRFVESQLDYYKKKSKEIIQREQKIREEERINLEKIKQAQMNQELLARVLSDSDDQQVKKKREKEQKRKQILQMLSEKAKQARDRRIEAEEQAQTEPKKKKRSQPKKPRRQGGKKRNEEKKKKYEEDVEEYPDSEPQYMSSEKDDFEDNEDEEMSRVKKHKKKDKESKKKKKKKKKQRERQRDMENSEEDEDYYGNKENEPSDEDEMEVSEKPRKIVKKDQDEDDGFDLSKFKVDE